MPSLSLAEVVYLLSLLSINSILIFTTVLAFSLPGLVTGTPVETPPYPLDSPAWDPEDPPTSISTPLPASPSPVHRGTLLIIPGVRRLRRSRSAQPPPTACRRNLTPSGRFMQSDQPPKPQMCCPPVEGSTPSVPERPAPLAVAVSP